MFKAAIRQARVILPGIMDFICNNFFLSRFEPDAEFDSLAVGLSKVVGLFHDLPVNPAVQMLDDPDFDAVLFLAVTDLDFKRFVQPVLVRINPIIRPFSFADHLSPGEAESRASLAHHP